MLKYFEDDYKPHHNFQWALSMAKQGHHLVCDQLEPGERLVYTTKASVHKYDESGLTIAERPIKPNEKNCRTWAFWKDPRE